ncbi:protein transport protein bet1 [Coniothyrium glycines]
MSSRFGRQDARDDLFSSYNRATSPSKSKNKPRSPYNAGYGYNPPPSADANGPAFGAYPGSSNGNLYPGGASSDASFRSATPNSRGQYSAAVLDELESQNNEQVGVLTGKVKMLKDLTHLIGDEIRESTTLADNMNDQFENSRHKIKGTMTRMLRMAQKTGVGWKAWLAFFAVVILLFWWVWLG